MGKKQTGLTPYQGPKRVFGAFRCEDCRKHWYSGNSWANTGQQCKSCGELVYPYSQVRAACVPCEQRPLSAHS